VALVDEVLAPWKHLVSEEELLVMRIILEGELLVDPEGRLELRRMLADPVVEQSDELTRRVAADDAEETEADEAEGEG
jgi:hypothetical protein